MSAHRAFFDAVHDEIQRRERGRNVALQSPPGEATADELDREAAAADARAKYHAAEALRLSAYAERMRVSAELRRGRP